jgi:hypothetical protein
MLPSVPSRMLRPRSRTLIATSTSCPDGSPWIGVAHLETESQHG